MELVRIIYLAYMLCLISSGNYTVGPDVQRVLEKEVQFCVREPSVLQLCSHLCSAVGHFNG